MEYRTEHPTKHQTESSIDGDCDQLVCHYFKRSGLYVPARLMCDDSDSTSEDSIDSIVSASYSAVFDEFPMSCKAFKTSHHKFHTKGYKKTPKHESCTVEENIVATQGLMNTIMASIKNRIARINNKMMKVYLDMKGFVLGSQKFSCRFEEIEPCYNVYYFVDGECLFYL